MTEKERYKFKREGVNDFDEYGLESPILLGEEVLTFGEVIDKLNEQEKRIKRVKEYINKEIKRREEDLKSTIKAGMPTGSLYSEIELFEEIQKLIDYGDVDD